MKTAGYFRESSKDTKIAPPIDNQIEAYNQWVKQNNHIDMQKYTDNGYSGGDWNRPGWNQAKKDAKRHLYIVLWVWNQDRIARDTEQFLHFYRILNDCNVKVFSQTEGWIDMSTLGGRVKHTALAQASEIFRLVTSEKVRQAYTSKKEKQGTALKWGRPRKDINEERILQIKKDNPDWGYRKIAEEIGNISYQTVRRVLQNRVIL